MNREALLLTLAAALLHASWNFAAKRAEGGGQVFVWGYAAASALIWVPITLVWSIWHPLTPTWTWVGAGFVSGMLHVAYGNLLQRGYSRGDLIGGVALVVAGVLVISFGRAHPDHPEGPGRRRAGVTYGVATGASIAAYTLWDAHAVTTLGIPAMPYFTLGVVFQCLGLTPGAWLRPRASVQSLLVRHWREILVVAVLSPLAYVLVLQALTVAPVSVVAPVRESSIVVGALLSWLVLREPHPARRLLGAAVVLAGVAALALS
jgi:drug/metabolite transporter (DMT)-like permease